MNAKERGQVCKVGVKVTSECIIESNQAAPGAASAMPQAQAAGEKQQLHRMSVI